MQFLTDIAVAVLLGYLAFTNFLADKIENLLLSDHKMIISEESLSDDSSFSSIPSEFNQDISDILLKSKEYQQAALAASDINRTGKDALSALVNIYCTFKTPTTIRTTTGSGFFVHSKGVILTNAHIAQFLLLKDTILLGEPECIVRTGNPAESKYRADLLYIPPTWIEKNASLIDSTAPTGTGERDYALLYVTESISDIPLPDLFPALKINTDPLPITTKDNIVQALGYPATEFLLHGVTTPLLPRIATTSISELYTFDSNYADVFSVKGSDVGAEGSSGGPVVDSNGEVIGIIVTRGDDTIDGQGSLRAITLSHIERTILEETSFSLKKNLEGDLEYRSEVFLKTLAPFMLELLSQELNN